MLSNKDECFLYFIGFPEKYKFAVYFYQDGERIKTEWYKESKFLRIKGYNPSVLVKAFIKNEKNELVDQFYIKDENLIKDSRNIKSLLDAELEKVNNIKFIYTDDDRFNYDNKIIILWMLSIIDPKSTTYLLHICSTVKSWVKNYTEETLVASKTLLNRQERTDAVIYYCFSVLSVFPWKQAQIEINDLYSSLIDHDNKNICKVFKALFFYEAGDFDKYCTYIKSVLETRSQNFDHYLFTPLGTVYTKNNLLDTVESDLKNKLFGYKINFNKITLNKGTRYIVSLSCNKQYFDLYFHYLIGSLDFHSKSYAVFIFFSDGDSDYYSKELEKYKNIYFFVNDNISRKNIGPISSILRYYYTYDLIKSFKKPVFVLDMDSVVFKDLRNYLDKLKNYDMASRILRKGVLPWEKYTGSFTIFNPTKLSIQTCLEIKFITEQTIRNDQVQWWVDQNILEAGIRQMKYRQKNLKIFNAINSRDEFIKMPVGQATTKDILLKDMYSASLSN